MMLYLSQPTHLTRNIEKKTNNRNLFFSPLNGETQLINGTAVGMFDESSFKKGVRLAALTTTNLFTGSQHMKSHSRWKTKSNQRIVQPSAM